MAYLRGEDYEFVDAVPGSFICPICTRVKKDAHQVTCCGKIYCKSCIEKNKSEEIDKFECPSCFSDLAEQYNYVSHTTTANSINQLRIRCINKGKGCIWIGKLKDLMGHRQICRNELVECTNNKKLEKCGVKVQRHELDVHMTQKCEWRIVKCPNCNEEGTFNHMLARHLEVCPDVELDCGNEGCSLRIKRCLLADHHDECPKQIVMCRFHFVGCGARLKREDISDHDRVSVEEHLSKAVTCIQDLESTTQISSVIKICIQQENAEVISSGFYVAKGGLKMAIKAKCDKRQSVPFNLHLHISVMPGRYDDLFNWPTKGKVRLKLLNQKEDKSHKIAFKDVIFQDKVVPPKIYGKWMHAANFVFNRMSAQLYSNNDTYYIKVTFDTNAIYKPWLI